MTTEQDQQRLEAIRLRIRNIPDFPMPGIQFKDITPILADAELFRSAVDLLCGGHRPGSIDAVAGIDARGFIFGAAVALQLKAGFIPIRKEGKLPHTTVTAEYELEYGRAAIAVHTDAVAPGGRVLLVDDLLATGGTAGAAVSLLNQLDARISEVVFLVELGFLEGRKKIPDGVPVRSLISF